MGPIYHNSEMSDSWAGKIPDVLDRKMSWLRRNGVVIFKNRGDIGPQKLYLNPNNSETRKDSWKKQRSIRSLLVNKEFNLSELQATDYSYTMTYAWQFFDNPQEYYIRVAVESMDAEDNGNTAGIIEKYKFKNPVWFNIVQINEARKEELRKKDRNSFFAAAYSSPTKLFAGNCVVDWYELRNYVEHLGPIGDRSDPLALGPFEALQRVHPLITLFANGPLFEDTETEFTYLTEIST